MARAQQAEHRRRIRVEGGGGVPRLARDKMMLRGVGGGLEIFPAPRALFHVGEEEVGKNPVFSDPRCCPTSTR